MNTFATMLSSPLREYLWAINEKKPVESLQVGEANSTFYLTDTDLIKDVRDFLSKCCQIGNMMVLPNIKGKNPNKTLNELKGGATFKFRDYMPLFLRELENCFTDNSDCDKNFKNIFNQNNFYFGQDKIDSFEKFCEKNYIDDKYWNKESFKFLFDEKLKKYIYWWNWTKNWNEADKANYFEVLNQYIDSATPLINERTDCIIDELKKFLK